MLWDSRCSYESVYRKFKCDGKNQQQRLQKLNLLVDFKNAQQLLDKKSRIRETPTLSTDADRRTDTNLKRLRDLSKKKI